MKFHKTQKGFTIIETLVAVTILIIAVLAPMSVASVSIKSAGFAREELVATMLAQEGIEYVIAARDDNAISGGGNWNWYTGLLPDCKNASRCDINVRNGTFISCGGAPFSTCQLRQDDSAATRGYYTHEGSGTLTPYTRTIQVTESVSDQEAHVRVEVTWDSGLVPGTVTSETRVFNLHQ